MSVIAAAVRVLMDAGRPQEEILAVISSMEAALAPVTQRSKGAERTARWRERKASQASQASQTVTECHNVTLCDASPPPPPAPSPSPRTPNPLPLTPSTSPNPKRGRDARACSLPSHFEPNDTHRRLASELGINLDAELAQFTDHHSARRSLFVDWDAALRTWIRNAKRFHPATQGKVAVDGQDRSVHAAAKRLQERLANLGDPAPRSVPAGSGWGPGEAPHGLLSYRREH